MNVENSIYKSKLFSFTLFIWISVIIGLMLWSYIGSNIVSFLVAFPIAGGVTLIIMRANDDNA